MAARSFRQGEGGRQIRHFPGAQPVRRRAVEKLYAAVVAPIAGKRTKGAWYRQWRLVSLDGSTLDVADTAENDQAFGRPGSSRGSSAFPKIRFVALLENGTHVLWAPTRLFQQTTSGSVLGCCSRPFPKPCSVREARLRARGIAQAAEAVRDQGSIRWLSDFLHDSRHGIRLLGRSPLFTAAAIVSLALALRSFSGT